MKNLLALSLVLVASCGYTSRGSELVGQVKKVVDKTPLLCSDYTYVDLSLGVMRNGVGSMSHEDVDLYVEGPTEIGHLKAAADSGALVRVLYDDARFPAGFCVPTKHVTSVELLK